MKPLDAVGSFHENERINELAQTEIGRCLIWLIACGLLYWHQVSLLAPLGIGVVWLFPVRRRLILSLGAVGMILGYYFDRQELPLSLLAFDSAYLMAWAKLVAFLLLVVGCLYVLYQFAKHLAKFPALISRHPILLLHSVVCAGLGVMIVFPPLNAFAELVPGIIWRISYMLQYGQRGGARSTSFSDHLFYLWPAYGGAGLPYGKGLDYLSKYEARDAPAQTRSSLAGLKTLFLATLWDGVLFIFEGVFYLESEGDFEVSLGFNLGLPTMDQVIIAQNASVGIAWLTIVLAFLHITLRFAVMGHIAVGVLRLAGFNIFRNTYKPLLAESIVDFWSRFNYYFKELMVEFFFYPTFLACHRVNPHLRMFLSVFAAAFVGNMYLHVLYSSNFIAVGNFQEVWTEWGARLVYCFMLAIGIWISMLRQQVARKVRTQKSALVRLRSIAGVWLFYSIAHIWNYNADGLTLTNRWNFCLALVGY